MVKRLIFHGGLPKTGTSFVQEILSKNAAVLEKNSVHYPLFRGPNLRRTTAGNHSLLFNTWDQKRPISEHMEDYLNIDFDFETIFFSAESIVQIGKVDLFLRSLLDCFPTAEIEFVFYLRRIDHWAESVYSEQAKIFNVKGIRSIVFSPRFVHRLVPFAVAVGRENLKIRPYNATHWPEGSIGADLFAAIGLPDVWHVLEEENKTNVSTNHYLARRSIC